MSGKGCTESAPLLSQRDQLSEKVIAALKYLSDECQLAGLSDMGTIVEDALERCLKQYVATKREGTAAAVGRDGTTNCPLLN